jgi:predicted TIM-barrel fold metal-dependent hydrolase
MTTSTAPTVSWPVYSCDDHLDFGAVPPDLWTERLPARFADRGPRVVEQDGGRFWVADGEVIGRSGQAVVGNMNAIARAGLEDDGYRAGTAKLRLEDMDLDGLQASVIYGPAVLGLPIADVELKAACYAAYNDWAAEFNGLDRARLCVLARLPSHAPEAAAAELARCAALDLRGAVLDPFEAEVAEPEWDRFWSVAGETRLPISFHLGGGTNRLTWQIDTWRGPAYSTVSQLQLDEPFTEVIFAGVFERHPGARLVLAEAGIGWIPYIVGRMDQQWKNYRERIGAHALSRKPSEIFRDHVWVTFEEEPLGPTLIPLVGATNCMWASDYPHPDSTFPHSRQAILEALGGLSEAEQRRVTSDNCRELYFG